MCSPTTQLSRIPTACRNCAGCRFGTRRSSSALRSEESAPRRKLTLLLGGGGVKAAAHLGVLNTVERAGVQVDSVYGSSAGALVALFYCAGYRPAEMFHLLETEIRPGRFWRFLPGGGLARLVYYLRWGGIARLVRKHIRYRNLEDLPKPLTMMTTDLESRSSRPLTSGPIESALMASMSLPGLARPIHRDGRWLIDGSLLADQPVDLARRSGADLVVAVDLNSSAEEPALTRRPSGWSSLFLPMLELARQQTQQADFVIRPRFDSGDWTDFSILQDLVARGEEATHACISNLLRACRRVKPARHRAAVNSAPPLSRLQSDS